MRGRMMVNQLHQRHKPSQTVNRNRQADGEHEHRPDQFKRGENAKPLPPLNFVSQFVQCPRQVSGPRSRAQQRFFLGPDESSDPQRLPAIVSLFDALSNARQPLADLRAMVVFRHGPKSDLQRLSGRDRFREVSQD